jgi:hypothetical protein
MGVTMYNKRYRGIEGLRQLAPLLWFGVSRMKRVDSSFQCCIKDGSRFTTYAVQTEYVNHLKVLCSKGMVLNVQEKLSAKSAGECKEAERK